MVSIVDGATVGNIGHLAMSARLLTALGRGGPDCGAVGMRARSSVEPSIVVAIGGEVLVAPTVAATWSTVLSRVESVGVGVVAGVTWPGPDGAARGPAVRLARMLAELAGPATVLVDAAVVGQLAIPDGWQLDDLGTRRWVDLAPPRRVFRLAPAGPAAPVVTLDDVAHSLPVLATSLVGRDDEIEALTGLLATQRLLTLVGPGGSGKTSLAASAAARTAPRWPDGIWWVDLGSVTRADDVAESVAAAVGALVEPAIGPVPSIVGHLRDRRALVVVDNCEHVLDGAAEVISALHAGCGEVTVLATSREAVAVPGEVQWAVPPLAADAAIELFVERARSVAPSFDPAGDLDAVRLVCDRLDGLPLAVELAAAWVRTLSLAQIDAGLEDRLDLLARGLRGAPPRQRSLAASIDWSHSLLAPDDRAVFRRLSVFVGDWSIDAASAVSGDGRDVSDVVRRLVEQSLVVARHDGVEARFRLLDTVRAYGRRQLERAGEVEATRDRLVDHCLTLVEATPADPSRHADMDAWRLPLEREYDNLRTALAHGLAAADPERGRRLAAALPWLWAVHPHGHEGMEHLGAAIRRAPDDRSTLQGRLLVGVAIVADYVRPLELDYDAAGRAVEIAEAHGDRALRAMCCLIASSRAVYADLDGAVEHARRAAVDGAVVGDAFVVAAADGMLGIVLHLRDRRAEALPLLRSSVARLATRHRGLAATVLGYLSDGAASDGDLALAAQLADEAIELAAPLGDFFIAGVSAGQRALVQAQAGDVDAAMATMEPFVRSTRDGDHALVTWMARIMGTLHLWRDEPAEVVDWFERSGVGGERGDGTYVAARGGPVVVEALRQLGRVDEARELLGVIAELADRLDLPRIRADVHEQRALLSADADEALDEHHRALAFRVDHGLRAASVDSLDGIGGALADLERLDDAARVLAAADATRATLGLPRRPALRRLRAGVDAPLLDGEPMDLDGAIAFVRRARGRRGRPTTGWASLTSAELEVVDLAVDGLANPEIAARLHMSRSTVKAHLSRVYAKTGTANRTELAARAATRSS